MGAETPFVDIVDRLTALTDYPEKHFFVYSVALAGSEGLQEVRP